jgi:hypothetical protein
MYRRDVSSSNDSLNKELQSIWDTLNRIKHSINQSVLPSGYSWAETTDGNIVVIDENGNIVLS